MCLVYEGIAKVVAEATGSTGTVNLTMGSHTTSFFQEPIILIPLLIIVCLFMAGALCYTRFGYNKLALVYDQRFVLILVLMKLLIVLFHSLSLVH